MRVKLLLISALALLGGCTAVNVKPVPTSVLLTNVCIVQNPAVRVSDFVDVLREGFSRHGIATTVVSEDAAKTCNVTLTYTARRTWDFKPYLSTAKLEMWQRGQLVGSAEYHLRGKGGLSLAKWAGTQSKMDPVIDELLATRR